MSGYEGETTRLQPPCPLCGNDSFSWGTVKTHAHQTSVDWEMSDRQLRWWLFYGNYRIRLRVCDSCGNLQFFFENKPEREAAP